MSHVEASVPFLLRGLYCYPEAASVLSAAPRRPLPSILSLFFEVFGSALVPQALRWVEPLATRLYSASERTRLAHNAFKGHGSSLFVVTVALRQS